MYSTYRLLFIECQLLKHVPEPYTMSRPVESLTLISLCPKKVYSEDAILSAESTLRTS